MEDDTSSIDNGPCQKLACKIQTCLSRNDYNQNKCKTEMENYERCVKDYKKRLEENKSK